MLKKTGLLLAALCLILTLVVGFTGCGGEEEATPTPGVTAAPTTAPTAAPAPPVKVGAVICLTGALSGMGPDIRDGYGLAVKEVNDAGGIDGSQIELIVEDSATESTTGFEAVKKLIELNGVKVIMGPMISGASLSSGPYLGTRKVLAISPSATSPDIADQDWRQFFFRTAPTDMFQGAAVAQLITEGNYEKVAIIVMDNQYGAGVAGVVKDVLEDEVEFVADIEYDPVKLDYLTELQIIKDSDPDVVVHVGYGDDGQIVYKQALELGLDTIQWITVEGVYSPKTLEMAEAAEFMEKAIIGTRAAAPEGSTYDTFAAKFEAEYGHAPNVYAENAYDAMMLAALAMQQAGTTDAESIAAALMQIGQNYKGASGTITFAANGDRLGGYYEVWEVVEEGGVYSYARVKIISL